MGLTATPAGVPPTGMVATTLSVAPSITETEPENAFATYTRFVTALTPTPCGLEPTGTVAMTALLDPSMTETLSETVFATYTRLVLGLTLIATGLVPTGMVATTVGSMCAALAGGASTSAAAARSAAKVAKVKTRPKHYFFMSGSSAFALLPLTAGQ